MAGGGGVDARGRRPPLELPQLRDAFGAGAARVGDLAGIFRDLRRARGYGRRVPVGPLADEIARKTFVDLTAADLEPLSRDGAISLEDLYAALYGGA